MTGGLAGSLRDATWLTAERVVAYSRMIVASYAGCVIFLAVTSHGGVNVLGKSIGGDFLCFWAAGALALKGSATAAYDAATLIAEQASVIAGVPHFPWVYPPVFLLPMVVLALLPYGISLLVWVVATFWAYVACLKRIAPNPHTLLVALAWPASFDNALSGQNGFLSAAVLGAGLLLLESRPVLAGLMLAILCYKPPLALLLPFALIAGKRWRALGAMVIGVASLCLAVTLAFGPDIWLAFDESGHSTQALLEGEHGTFLGKIGVFSVVRLLGGSVAVAWIVQWPVSVAMALLILWSWRQRAPFHLKCALLVAAIPLAAPWLNTYDLAMLALPAAWLIRDGMNGRFLPWELIAIVAVASLPILARAIASVSPIQVAPLVESAFVVVILQRLRLAMSGPAV